MNLPLQIAFRNLPHSDEVEARIRTKAERLDALCDQVMGCRVVVDVPHRHHQHGNQYQVRIDLTVPGEEIVVNQETAEHTTHRDLEVAIRDAFDAAGRRLEDYVRRHRHAVKAHEAAPHARVSRVFPAEGYGFLATPDGREVYFHAHSLVAMDLENLPVGTEVAFVEEAGDKGPQASTVKVVGRHHHL